MQTAVTVNWDLFVPTERQLIEEAIDNGHVEHLAAILYEVTPEKAAEIERIQKQLRPREFTFQSEAQQEADIWMSQNYNEMTPEKAAEWEAKIQAEKQAKLAALSGSGIVQAEMETVDGSKDNSITLSNNLSEVKGLGPNSIKKLNVANIFTVDELRKLPQDERRKLLGPLVAHKIKNLT